MVENLDELRRKAKVVAMGTGIDIAAAGGGTVAGLATIPLGNPIVAAVVGGVLGAILGDIGASAFSPVISESLTEDESKAYTEFSRFMPEGPAVFLAVSPLREFGEKLHEEVKRRVATYG